jgi:TPR repeat protein
MSFSDDDERFWHLFLDATHLEALGKYGEAELIWQEAARQGSAEGSFRLGLAAERRNDTVEARTRYEIAANLGHDTAMFALGKLNEELGKRSDAERMVPSRV